MKTASCKQKGRNLQKYVRSKILKLYPQLTERDVESTPMGCSGEDIKLSQTAFNLFPFSIECKNQEKLNIWDSLEQSSGNNRQGIPLLIFKRNRSEVYCAMKLEDLLKSIKKE